MLGAPFAWPLGPFFSAFGICSLGGGIPTPMTSGSSKWRGRHVPGCVLWEEAEAVGEANASQEFIDQTVISSDGARMVYAGKAGEGNDTNLFLRLWDGSTWGESKPMRALNSKFHENSPTLSGDGNLLLFSSNRPGGQGGEDIWVSKWDGVEYAWPLPLSATVNTPFDEIDPAITPDSTKLFFSSNRPHPATDISEKEAMEATVAAQLENVDDRKVDFDLFSADVASSELLGLFSERQQSILYSLREGALGDTQVMTKLGGTEQSEKAVDKALAYLVSIQEEDGRWDIQKTGGGGGHDMAATAFSLLAFYGRGERHDLPCKYKDNVRRGLDWLIEQQLPNGDLAREEGQHVRPWNCVPCHGRGLWRDQGQEPGARRLSVRSTSSSSPSTRRVAGDTSPRSEETCRSAVG